MFLAVAPSPLAETVQPAFAALPASVTALSSAVKASPTLLHLYLQHYKSG